MRWRRVGAFGVQLAILIVPSVAVMRYDARTDFLNGWDTVHLGYTSLIVASVAIACLTPQPWPLTLFGLKMMRRDGRPVSIARRGVNELLFWLLVTTPGILPVSSVARAFGFAPRQETILQIVLTIVLVGLPGITAAATGGAVAIHDALTGVRLKRLTEPAEATAGQWVRMLRWTSLTCAAVIAAVIVSDWRLGASGEIERFLNGHPAYFERVFKDLQSTQEAALFLGASGLDSNYWNDDATVVLAGQSQRFLFPASRRELRSTLGRREAAIDRVRAVLAEIHGRTVWVSINLSTSRSFGPFVMQESYELLWDVKDKKLRDAPEKQLYYAGARSYQIGELNGVRETIDSVITTFKPKWTRSFGLFPVGWRFPSLDFTRRPRPPMDRFVGRK